MPNSEKKLETLRTYLLHPDLTKAQRKEAFLLREQLRYQKNVPNKKNVKISRGRIVEIEKDTSESVNEDNQDNVQDTGLFGDVSEGAAATAGHRTSSD